MFAALQVFYGHAVAHLKLPTSTFASSVFAVFRGVPIFFILSGFLIWNSLDRTPNLKTFVKKRVLRLYPELWCAVILSVLSIVILYDGFRIRDLALFTVGQATVFQFWTPEALRGFGCGTPNGSLWTISVIVQFYIVAWFLKKLTRKKSGLALWIGMLICSLAIGFVSPVLSDLMPSIVYKLYNQTIIPYLWIFLIGTFICEYFQILIPQFKRYWFLSLIGLLLVCFTGFDIHGNYGVLATLLQAITWLGFAYALPGLNIKHDISYGIYLYHMVILNILIQLGFIGHYGWFVIALVLTFLIASASYVLTSIYGMKRRK